MCQEQAELEAERRWNVEQALRECFDKGISSRSMSVLSYECGIPTKELEQIFMSEGVAA